MLKETVQEVAAIGNPENLKAGKAPKLKDRARALLGDETTKLINTAKVTVRGFEFFRNGHPETAWVAHPMTPTEVYGHLMAAGIFNMQPAYQAQIDGEPSPVFLSTYQTQRAFGAAPALELGDQIEIWAIRNDRADAGFSFAYKTLKRVS